MPDPAAARVPGAPQAAPPARPPRDDRIDTLRGFALVWITCSHLKLFFSAPFWASFGFAGFGETFVFLSGLVTGMVYWRVAQHAPPRVVWSKALRRAGVIYASYLGLALFILGYVHLAHQLGSGDVPHGTGVVVENPTLALWAAPFFLYQPGYADILPMYAFFLAVTPPAVFAVQRGRADLCLALSVALWLAAQLGASHLLFAPITRRTGLELPSFDLLAWQLVFLTGLLFGIRRARGQALRLPDSRTFWALLVVAAVLLFFVRHGIFFPGIKRALWHLGRPQSLGPLRIVNFVVWALLVARVATVRPAWVQQPWLALLGRHSLQVFVFSSVAAYLVFPLARADGFVQLLAAVAVLASLTLPARLHQRYVATRAHRRRGLPRPGRAASASPAP